MLYPSSSSSSNCERIDNEAIIRDEEMEMDIFRAATNGDVKIFDKLDCNNDEHCFLRKSVNKNNILHIAIRYGQGKFVIEFLERNNSTINERIIAEKNSQGNTPFHVAAEVGNLDIVKRLYEYMKKSVDKHDVKNKPWTVKNSEGNTAVHVAILCHNIYVANFLLHEDHDFALIVNNSMEAPLHLAITQHIDSISTEPLKKASCVGCWPDADGSTPLHRAASLDTPFNLVYAKKIIHYCPQSTLVCDASGKTILHLLVDKVFNRKIIDDDLLCLNEISILKDHQDHDGNTPLHIAAKCDNIDMVKSLRDSSAKLHIKNNAGISAWSMIQQKGLLPQPQRRIMENEESSSASAGDIEYLWKRYSAEIKFLDDSQDNMGRNFLHLLMNQKAINHCYERDKCGNFLHFIEVALFLYPKLVCQTDQKGNTPVHILAQNNEFRRTMENQRSWDSSPLSKLLPLFANAVDKIKSRGINQARNYNLPWVVKNEGGNTPLHEAILANNKALALELLSYSQQSAQLVNNKTKTPLHLLADSQVMEDITDEDIMKIVKANFAALGLAAADGLTPISRALKGNNIKMVVALLSNDLGFRDLDGQTLWHLFLKSDPSYFSDDLLQNQAFRKMFEQQDKDKNTPLHLAMKEKCFDFVLKILETWEEEHKQWLMKLLRMLDNDGLRPIIRAFQADNLELATKLCRITPEATETGDADDKTIWHLLLKHPKYNSANAKELFRDVALRESLKRRDKHGNTSLHLAIKDKSFTFVEDLLETWGSEAESSQSNHWMTDLLRIPNKVGETPEDLLADLPTISKKLEKLLLTDHRMMGIRSSWSIPRTQLQNYMNSMNVIAALQTTITFTAAFAVPGGLVQEIGTPLLIQRKAFQAFMISDVIAMCLSMMVLICLLWMAATNKRESVLIQDFALYLLLASFVATLMAFMMGIYATIYPIKLWIAITTLVLCSLLMLLLPRFMLIKLVLLLKKFKVPFVKNIRSRGRLASSSNTEETEVCFRRLNCCARAPAFPFPKCFRFGHFRKPSPKL